MRSLGKAIMWLSGRPLATRHFGGGALELLEAARSH
jgi:hypothetical protein